MPAVGARRANGYPRFWQIHKGETRVITDWYLILRLNYSEVKRHAFRTHFAAMIDMSSNHVALHAHLFRRPYQIKSTYTDGFN